MSHAIPKAPRVVRRQAPLLDTAALSFLEGNLCTPSVIALPNWAWEGQPDLYGSAKLACFFAHHTGRGIRLAVADVPEGPWRVISMASPGLAETPFGMADPVISEADGPPDWMDLGTPEGRARAGLRSDGPPWRMIAHIASPDVHVDLDQEYLWMTYHGLLQDGEQGTRFATSQDGVVWDTGSDDTAPLLGPPYFRGFQGPDGARYALTFGGYLYRAEVPWGPYEAGPCLVPPDAEERPVRHIEGHVRGAFLHLFYSRIGDAPECLYHAYVSIDADWQEWRAVGESVLLIPDRAWEGSDVPVTASRVGAAIPRERALRDPCIFDAPNGRSYLYYCGGGESTLCLAELFWED